MAEAPDLKSVQSGFESLLGHISPFPRLSGSNRQWTVQCPLSRVECDACDERYKDVTRFPYLRHKFGLAFPTSQEHLAPSIKGSKSLSVEENNS
jgi:hypothetical protein